MDQQLRFIHKKQLFSKSVLLVCGSWPPCPSLLLTSFPPVLPPTSRSWRPVFMKACFWHPGTRHGWGPWRRALSASSGMQRCYFRTSRLSSQHTAKVIWGISSKHRHANPGHNLPLTSRILQDQTALAMTTQQRLFTPFTCTKSYPGSQPSQSWHHP